MASTYSTNLALELIGTGDQSGTWGATTNTNLGTLIEQAISGYVTQAITDGADTTITIPNGATGVARNMYLELTGALTAARNLIVPANKKLYFIYNNTTGGYAVTVKVSGQTGVSVPNGKKMVLVVNGTDVVAATSYLSSLALGSALPTTSGGTGLTSFTANGVVYASSTSVLATGSGLVFDGTNLGINQTSPGSKLDVKGTLRLSGSSSGYVGLAPAADAGSTTYTLPSADGTNGQVIQTNGSGVLSWGSNLPSGTLLDYAGTSAPSGFLACDGSAVSRSTYATLFSAIGTTWGAGNGTTTFNVPDFRRRVAVGSGGTGTATLGNAVGNTGGEETHILTIAELAAHTHQQTRNDIGGAQEQAYTGPTTGNAYATATGNGVAIPTQSTGSGNAHNNMQPSAVVLKIIKT